MLVTPKIRSFICTTAHPQGCIAHTKQWIDYVKNQNISSAGPKRVLVIGASTGFGLASRIVAAFGYRAQTIGIFFEKPAQDNKRTATAGWYNTVGFEQAAHKAGLYAKSLNGDAFSSALKAQTFDLIAKDWGQVDLVIYSIASPRRQHPVSGEIFNSVLKPIGKSYKNKTVDVMNGVVTEIEIPPASESEVVQTEAVMGGEDWALWIEGLLERNLLAQGAQTVAFTYIGPELTHPIYKNGTIGAAKAHLEATAREITKTLQETNGGEAIISVNKALVTQASAAIPVVPLYISLLYKVMKEQGLHEGCIEQMFRLFNDHLIGRDKRKRDSAGRIRLDDYEMKSEVQEKIKALWPKVNSENLSDLADLEGYRTEFRQLFGFDIAGIDYQQDVDINISIPSLM